ncbi:MAG: type II toxin-antitoxin system VapC family toxin [Solirubrobacteraceae bacterium]
MIVDASALVAIVLAEPTHDRLLAAFDEAPSVGIGAPTVVETRLVLARRIERAASAALALLMESCGAVVVPFEAHHADAAMEAHWRFGKGRHPAALNFGDCMTYAVAKLAREPLLCVGDDFAQTDLELVPLR